MTENQPSIHDRLEAATGPAEFHSDNPLDAYVERADPHTPVLGFGPHPTNDRKGT